MSDHVTGAKFQTWPGVQDWRVLATTFATRVGIRSLDEGARLLARIAGLAEAHTCRLQVDVRPESVTIRLPFRDAGSPTREDAELARAISAEARALGLRAAAGSVQEVHLAIDAMSPPTVIPFWKAVLGYDAMGEEDIVDPEGAGPWIWFQQMDAPRPQRNRIHVDIYVPPDLAQARIEAALSAGGRLVTSEHAPSWWVLADLEGNEACIATRAEFERVT